MGFAVGERLVAKGGGMVHSFDVQQQKRIEAQKIMELLDSDAEGIVLNFSCSQMNFPIAVFVGSAVRRTS